MDAGQINTTAPAEAAAPPVALDDELVQLAVAAALTYFHLTDARQQVAAAQEHHERVHLAALALAQVTPLYRVDAAGVPARLGERELSELLLRPLEQPRTAPIDLDGLCIRRGDLRTALGILKDSRRF